jgi:hypothetical protein
MIPLLLHLLTTPALPCGGGDYANITAPLVQPWSHVQATLYPGMLDGYSEDASVTRFQHALRALDPAWPELEAALAGGDANPDPSGRVAKATAAFHKSLDQGYLEGAREAAAETVEAILDLPVPLAEPHGEALRLAVEFLEVRAILKATPELAAWFRSTSADPAKLPSTLAALRGVRGAATDALPADPRHPRAASIRWRQLQDRLRTEVPDGWSPEDIRSQAPGGFGALHAAIDAWLTDFPRHPLADYGRLKKVRLHYLAGEAAPAWQLLIDLYGRHPVRAGNEMRFLVQQGLNPEGVDPAKLPPELAVALSEWLPLPPDLWGSLWQQAQGSAPWAIPAQERLLLTATEARVAGTPLPPAFPSAPAAPTVTWAHLRLGGLLVDGRADDALAQLALLPADDPAIPPIRAHLYLVAGDPTSAAATPGLDPDAMRYLVRILLTTEQVARLIDTPDPEVRWEARLALASRRLAESGDWQQGAALLDPVDPERAARWREIATLSTDRSPAGVLALARYLRSHGGQIFVRADNDEVWWYRALPVIGYEGYDMGPLAPPYPEQARRAAAWLQGSFATWRAVQAYARWLEMLEVRKLRGESLREARAVLDEADVAYNLLLNYGSGDYYAWNGFLPQTEEAQTIRRVGAALRAKMP